MHGFVLDTIRLRLPKIRGLLRQRRDGTPSESVHDVVRPCSYVRFRDWVQGHAGETATVTCNDFYMMSHTVTLSLDDVDHFDPKWWYCPDVLNLVSVTWPDGDSRRCSLPGGPDIDYDHPYVPDDHDGEPCPIHDELAWRVGGPAYAPLRLRPREGSGHLSIGHLPPRLASATCGCGQKAVVLLEAFDADGLRAWSGPRCREHAGGEHIVKERTAP